MFFLIELNLQISGAVHFTGHILQRKYVQQSTHGDDRHIVQGDTVHENLKHRCNDGKRCKEQQRSAHAAAQLPEILYDNRHLQKKNRQRNQIAHEKTRCALVAVHLVKGIIEAGKLRDNHHRHTQQSQNLCSPQPFWSFLKAAFVGVEINQILIKAVNDDKRQKNTRKLLIRTIHQPNLLVSPL